MVNITISLFVFYIIGVVVSMITMRLYLLLDERISISGSPDIPTFTVAIFSSWIGAYITMLNILIGILVHVYNVSFKNKRLVKYLQNFPRWLYVKMVK